MAELADAQDLGWFPTKPGVEFFGFAANSHEAFDVYQAHFGHSQLDNLERNFENNQIGLRGVHRHDFGYAPESGIVCLKGIN